MLEDSFSSIEDLIDAPKDGASDESNTSKLEEKQKEVKNKVIEKSVEKAAAGLGLPYIQLLGTPISQEALKLVPEVRARELKAACFFYDGKHIRIAAINPTDEVKALKDQLAAEYFSETKIYLVSEHNMDYLLSCYKNLPKVKKIIKGVEISQEELNKYQNQFSSFKELDEKINSSSTTEIITMLIASAIQLNASDIHIEREARDIKVRFRVDGVLHDAVILKEEAWSKVISRLKLLTGVKINIANKPQDGRMTIFLSGDQLDIRASFLPTSYGESVVMRILQFSTVSLDFEQLGLDGDAYERLKRQIARPNGMIVTTGPTGSGKTTTLYAALRKLNQPEVKIITVEDPIEYQLEGINQSQVSENYTFAKALRSIVRQDPDVIMVGEIRDLETADVAIQAALTGHLVLSTIHTNDAAGAVPRFLSLGVKPFLLAPAINAMMGQRLVRKICENCKEEDKLDKAALARVVDVLSKIKEEFRKDIDLSKDGANLKFYHGKGCEKCQGLGYKGRLGIFEIVVMSEELEKLILKTNISEYDMREYARQKGYLTMAQDGLLKALRGATSVEEVFRVAE